MDLKHTASLLKFYEFFFNQAIRYFEYMDNFSRLIFCFNTKCSKNRWKMSTKSKISSIWQIKKPWVSRRSGWVGERVARFFTHNLNAKKTLKFSITSYDSVLSPSNSRPQPDESLTSELYLSRNPAFKDRWIFRYWFRKVLAQCASSIQRTVLKHF